MYTSEPHECIAIFIYRHIDLRIHGHRGSYDGAGFSTVIMKDRSTVRMKEERAAACMHGAFVFAFIFALFGKHTRTDSNVTS